MSKMYVPDCPYAGIMRSRKGYLVNSLCRNPATIEFNGACCYDHQDWGMSEGSCEYLNKLKETYPDGKVVALERNEENTPKIGILQEYAMWAYCDRIQFDGKNNEDDVARFLKKELENPAAYLMPKDPERVAAGVKAGATRRENKAMADFVNEMNALK